MLRLVTADDLTAAREAGRLAAERFINEQAPSNPVLKVAWAAGHGRLDAVKAAVDEARAAGVTWREISDALDENLNTVKSRFTQPDRYRKWVEKTRARQAKS